MNWDQVEGNWKQMKGAVKQKWGKLTDDDLTAAKGRAEILAGQLQQRYGMTKEEAQRQMDDFLQSQGMHTHTHAHS